MAIDKNTIEIKQEDTYTIEIKQQDTFEIQLKEQGPQGNRGFTGNGIAIFELTSSNVLTDTYTITFTDGETTTIDVENGRGISNIELTSSSGLIDTYTITYNDNTTSTFNVYNGNGIDYIAKTGTNGLNDVYTIYYTNGDTDTFEVPYGNVNIEAVANDLENIDTVANMESAIGTVVSNIDNIDNILDNIDKIDTVSQSISAIGTVSANIDDVETVSESISTIGTVSSDLGNINSVAGSLSSISSVSNNLTNINSVANNETNINAVNSNKANIDTVAINISDINTVEDNIDKIGMVSDNIADVWTLSNNIIYINNVANDLTNIETVANDLTIINNVATNISDINTVVTNMSDINNVADDLTNINAVANDLTNIDNASSYADLAEDWANKMDGPVDGNEFSAKYYAQQSSQSQIQSNWNETNPSSKAYIQNKPDIIKDITINDTSIVDDNGYADINVVGDDNIDVSLTSTPVDIDVSGTGSITLDNAKANGLNSVTLSGGFVQSGTPTPANPIDIICNNGIIKVSPNLFNKNLVPDVNEYINRSNGNASAPTSGEFRHSDFIVIKENTQYYVGIITSVATSVGLAFYDDTKTYISGLSLTELGNNDNIITSPNNTKYIRFSFRTDEGYNTNWQNTVYLVEGNQPLAEFMPYGQIYTDGTTETITDSLDNTATAEMLLGIGDYVDTQEIISGSVTHKVGIKVLDGTESWTKVSAGGTQRFYMTLTDSISISSRYNVPITHFHFDSSLNDVGVGFLANKILYLYQNPNWTVQEFKDWLAGQYSNGTAVIVAYPLATATTETVTGQPLTTQAGTNIVEITQASISNLPISANYDSLNCGKNLEISFTGIDSTDVTTALGYTPYNSTNPDGYITASALSGYEQTTNKVTSITSSNTDTQYPSAKAVYTATNANATAISTINGKIPSQATISNQLADKAFVNSSISTNTANFIGTFQSVAELEAYSGTKTNNDYAFVETTDTAGNTLYDRYKYNGTSWLFEYELNNSSFTAAQWATINSGCTSTTASLAASALQPSDNISLLNNNAGYITGITSSMVTTALSYTPENASNKVTSLSSSSTDTQYPSAKCVYDALQNAGSITITYDT